MDDDLRRKYKIADMQIHGTIEEVGPQVPFTSGARQGVLRNVVVRTEGLFGPALVPITVFGEDAEGLDPALDVGRELSCTGRLSSNRYLSHRGDIRWTMSMAAVGTALGPREPAVTPGPKPDTLTPLESAPEDLPF